MITFYEIILRYRLPFLKGGAAVQNSWRRPGARGRTKTRDGKLLHSGFAVHHVYAWAKRGERNPMKRTLVATLIIIVLFLVFIPQTGAQMGTLLSWNDGPVKQRILRFVEKVTKENGPHYVPPAECIAIFDSDGTLWPERPLPIELYFVIERLRQLAPKHPQWRKTPPFKVLFEKNPKALTH